MVCPQRKTILDASIKDMTHLLKKTVDIDHMPLACGHVGDGVGGLRPVLPVGVEIFHILKR